MGKRLVLILATILVLVGTIFVKSEKYSAQQAAVEVSREARLPKPELSDGGQATSTGQITNKMFDSSRVVRVIDGDTVELADGRRVRYIGIDTPELSDPGKKVDPDRIGVACFGEAAKAENVNLVEGKEVRLVKDVSETDNYKRLLRYVYVGDVFVNDHLVRQGFAHVVTYPPDVAYSGQFLEAEREARENKRGLWLDCTGSQ